MALVRFITFHAHTDYSSRFCSFCTSFSCQFLATPSLFQNKIPSLWKHCSFIFDNRCSLSFRCLCALFYVFSWFFALLLSVVAFKQTMIISILFGDLFVLLPIRLLSQSSDFCLVYFSCCCWRCFIFSSQVIVYSNFNKVFPSVLICQFNGSFIRQFHDVWQTESEIKKGEKIV